MSANGVVQVDLVGDLSGLQKSLSKGLGLVKGFGSDISSAIKSNELKPTVDISKAKKQFKAIEGEAKDSAKKSEKSFMGIDFDGVSTKGAAAFGAIAAAGAGVASMISGELMEAFSVASDIQFSGNRSAALLGLDPAETKRLGRINAELFGDAYGESLDDIADTTAFAVRALGGDLADVTDEELVKFSSALFNIENAFGRSAEETSDAVRGMITNGLVDSTEEALDILTRGLQIDSSGDILDTYREYGTELKQVGLSAEEFLSIAEAGLGAGARNSDILADAIKESNIIMQEGTDDSREALQALGYDAEQVQNIIAAGGPEAKKTYKDILLALTEMDDKTLQNKASVALLGTKYEDLGDDVIAAMANASGSMEGVEGAADRLDSNINNNFATIKLGIKRDLQASFAGYVDDFIVGSMKVNSGFNNMRKKFKRGTKIIKGAWTNTVRDFKIGAIRINKFFTEDIPSAIGKGVAVIKSLPGKAKEALVNLKNTLVEKGKNLISGMVSGVLAGRRKLVEKIKAIPGKVKDAIPNPLSVLSGIGKKLIDGLINGISSKMGALKDKLQGVTGWIKQWKGPEDVDKKLLVPAGEFIMDGLVDGIDDGEGALDAALADVKRRVEAQSIELQSPVFKDPTAQREPTRSLFLDNPFGFATAPTPVNVTINMTQPRNAKELVDEIEQELASREF